MMRPGTNVTVQSQLPSNTPPINTGTWFIVGITSQGPVTPQSANSLASWQQIYGLRGTNPTLSDSVEAYFLQGGTQVITGRLVGPGAASASVQLKDTSAPTPLNALLVSAAGPGAYANGYQLVVASVTGGYTITVEDSSNNVLEQSNTLVTLADAVAYGKTSSYVTVANNGSGTWTTTGSTTSASNAITAIPSTANMTVGEPISGAGIPVGATIASITSGTAITISAAATATAAGITLTVTGTTAPANGTFALAGGVDDIANITNTQYTNALATFTLDLGPGQVSAPGVTTSAIQTAVVSHCDAFGRVAYLDALDSSTAATVTGNTTPVRALGTPARKAATFAPWCDIAALPGTNSGPRAVPPSAFAAGKAAWVDVTTGNPNQAAAGVYGDLTGVVNLHATFSSTDRQTLNTAGVNVIRKMPNGAIRIYGNVTAVDRIVDPLYFMLSNVRLDMAIVAQGQAIAEEYMFSQIDGAGNDASDYGNELVNMLTAWQTLGALFLGANGRPAFTVDTSADINTPTTASQGQLLATIATVRSPGAEQVNLNIVRVSAAQGL